MVCQLSGSLLRFRMLIPPLSPRKEQRRMVQQEFDREGSARFDPLLARASHVLLAGLIDRPEDWHNRMRL